MDLFDAPADKLAQNILAAERLAKEQGRRVTINLSDPHWGIRDTPPRVGGFYLDVFPNGTGFVYEVDEERKPEEGPKMDTQTTMQRRGALMIPEGDTIPMPGGHNAWEDLGTEEVLRVIADLWPGQDVTPSRRAWDAWETHVCKGRAEKTCIHANYRLEATGLHLKIRCSECPGCGRVYLRSAQKAVPAP